MRWASAVSTRATLADAVPEVVASLRAALAGARPDLLLVFVSVHHGLGWAELPGTLRAAFPGARLVGASGAGILGDGEEHEGEPALSVVAAVLPDVEVRPFHLPRSFVAVAEGPDDDELDALIEVDPAAPAAFVVLTDPFSCNVTGLIDALDRRWPHGTKIGAIASGSDEPGRNGLFLDDALLRDGAVGVALTGAVELATVVAQGCRPVGAPLRVTALDGPLVLEVDGEPALGVFHRLFRELDEPTRRLFQVQPMVGVAVDPTRAPRRGDFVIRPIAGVNPGRHGVVVGHALELGDVIQFHVRDPVAATEELHELLGRAASRGDPPAGVLAFTCLGRGRRFFRRPDVDSRTVRELLGPVALGGLFGHGEIGPVHGRTCLHATTVVLGLFRAPSWN